MMEFIDLGIPHIHVVPLLLVGIAVMALLTLGSILHYQRPTSRP